MPDNVTNELLLEHMKAVRAELAAMRTDIREIRDRQTETHSAVLAVRRDQAQDAEVGVHLAGRVDRLYDRLDRIERRLDLTDTPAE